MQLLREPLKRLSGVTTPPPPLPPHQPRPSCRPCRAGRRLMDASAFGTPSLRSFVAVARDASASSVARAFVGRPRLARSSDGGNDVTLDDYRTDASDASG